MTNIPRMKVDDIFFIFIDLQEKLLAKIPGADRIVSRNLLLVQAARSLKVPHVPTSQYAIGLGPVVPALIEKMGVSQIVWDKTFFSCSRDKAIQEHVDKLGRRTAVVSGVETHICVLQTTLDMLELGYDVFVAADAVGSRNEIDHKYGLKRMSRAGATIATVEMILYELLGCSDSPEFKRLLPYIKQS